MDPHNQSILFQAFRLHSELRLRGESSGLEADLSLQEAPKCPQDSGQLGGPPGPGEGRGLAWKLCQGEGHDLAHLHVGFLQSRGLRFTCLFLVLGRHQVHRFRGGNNPATVPGSLLPPPPAWCRPPLPAGTNSALLLSGPHAWAWACQPP